MDLQLIETVEEFEKITEKDDTFFLLKHSITCPISAEAKVQFENYASESKTPTYILHVQEARPLSNEIAEKYGVKHESPQALLFQKNKIVWNASHWDVTKKALLDVDKQYM